MVSLLVGRRAPIPLPTMTRQDDQHDRPARPPVCMHTGTSKEQARGLSRLDCLRPVESLWVERQAQTDSTAFGKLRPQACRGELARREPPPGLSSGRRLGRAIAGRACPSTLLGTVSMPNRRGELCDVRQSRSSYHGVCTRNDLLAVRLALRPKQRTKAADIFIVRLIEISSG